MQPQIKSKSTLRIIKSFRIFWSWKLFKSSSKYEIFWKKNVLKLFKKIIVRNIYFKSISDLSEDKELRGNDRFSLLENAAKNVQNKLINMAEEDSDSGSSLVGSGLGGRGQSNKPKKVARRGGQGARGSQGGWGARGGGGGEGAEELWSLYLNINIVTFIKY